MKSVTAIAAILVIVAAACPAHAEHTKLVASDTEMPETRLEVPGADTSLDINLKLGINGFRLGGRLFGRDGYTGGAWLNGETRKDGFSLDGRIERDGKAHNFKFNADIDEWFRRAMRLRGNGLDL
jgi:hypothetical protein